MKDTHDPATRVPPRYFKGGVWGISVFVLFLVSTAALLYFFFIFPRTARHYGRKIPFNQAMFSQAIEQPISFSHRVHVTDKEIDCYYCHPYPERSMNAGLPSGDKCLACHDHIIPLHQEIVKLKQYQTTGRNIPWVRVYYNPDHVFFPHYRHITNGVECRECHGEIEQVDRLHKVTFYMGFCMDCHRASDAPIDCTACHQ
jgi:hypothetical protein